MNNFVLNVVRAEDLLLLRFEFVNLILAPDESSVPRLIRASPAEEALVIVHFPPQHIAEEAFAVNGIPQVPDPVQSIISGESRLGFRLPTDLEALPLTMETLLTWDDWEPMLIELDPETPGINMPLRHQTAIELPYRLTLSPQRTSHWEHHSQPFAAGGRAELWHTRLVAKAGAPSAPRLRLWAVWSPDHPEFTPIENPFLMSLGSKERGEIVQLSSDFSLLDESKFEILNSDELEELERLRSQVSRELLGDDLMLSALGGWLRAHSRFFFPPLGNLIFQMKGHELNPTDQLFSFSDWSHVTALGRDQYVRTVARGFLYPFGHRASVIKISERMLISAGLISESVACLTQRRFLVIQEPERQYDSRAMPFVNIRMKTLVTPDLDILPDEGDLEPFVPTVDRIPFAFPVSVTDKHGAASEVSAPMVWIPADQSNLADVEEMYSRLSRVDFSSQQVAFAVDEERTREERAVPSHAGRTTLKTVAMHFGHGGVPAAPDAPSFAPQMRQAEVRLPAVDHLVGPATGQVPSIRFHQHYVQQGFDGNAEQVFAEIIGGLPLSLPADKAGGLAAPEMKLTGLSVLNGAVPNAEGLLRNQFKPDEMLEGLGGRLLGVIPLKDVVAPVKEKGHLPKLKTEAVPGGHQASFEWNPPLKEPLPEPLKKHGRPALNIKGTLFRPMSSNGPGPSAEIEGTLSDVAILFVDVLELGFRWLSFHTLTGRKPEFAVAISRFEFRGDLSFLRSLDKLLQDLGVGGSSGPDLLVTAEHISARLTVAVARQTLGPFTLQNLAFSSEVTLFLSEKPATVRFQLSSRNDPFLVSYSVFGGGGYFALCAGTDGEVDVEASLQFGAAAAVDLVLARGTAQLMAGIEFSMQDEKVKLGGFVRLYGCLEILEIVTISVDFFLSLHYDPPDARGEARLTVMVRALSFSRSVTLTVRRSFRTEARTRSFEQAIELPEWREYCDAFA